MIRQNDTIINNNDNNNATLNGMEMWLFKFLTVVAQFQPSFWFPSAVSINDLNKIMTL